MRLVIWPDQDFFISSVFLTVQTLLYVQKIGKLNSDAIFYSLFN